MPGYISITPRFNPISLQEYLTVPTMIIEGRQREAEKLEAYQNEAEKIKSLMGDSEEAKAAWASYNEILNGLGDDIMNNRASDIARVNRQLRNSYRTIKSRAEDAYARRSKYQDLINKNPNLIGDVGDFMTYYNNPDYNPNLIDGTQILKGIKSLTNQYSTELGYRATGQYVGDKSNGQALYVQGMTPEELQISLYNATSGTPRNNYELSLMEQLASYGYYNADPYKRRQIERYFYQGMQEGNPFKTNIVDELRIKNQKLSIQQKYKSLSNNNDKPSSKLQYQGVISAKPTSEVDDNIEGTRYPSRTIAGVEITSPYGKKVTVKGKRKSKREEDVNLTNASIPENATLIDAQQARAQYKDQYDKLFSENKKTGYELSSNDKYYNFFVDEDDNLYIVPNNYRGTSEVSNIEDFDENAGF